MNLALEKREVNIEGLHEELFALLGSDLFDGVGVKEAQVTVYLKRDVSEVVQAQIVQTVDKHDSTRRTARQQADAAREAQREQFRENPLPLDTYASAQAPIKLLAERVAWLEAEMLRLAGGGNVQ